MFWQCAVVQHIYTHDRTFRQFIWSYLIIETINMCCASLGGRFYLWFHKGTVFQQHRNYLTRSTRSSIQYQVAN